MPFSSEKRDLRLRIKIREYVSAWKHEVDLEDTGGPKLWGDEPYELRVALASYIYEWEQLTKLEQMLDVFMAVFPEYKDYPSFVRAQYSPEGKNIVAKMKKFMGPNGYAMYCAAKARSK